jgi:CRP-like cAMP-binding protein
VTESTAEKLAQLALFADLSPAQVEAVAHTFDEQVFPEGQRVLRDGLSGSSFYVILAGEAAVVIDGEERSRLGRGEFFGEISALTGGPPTADVVAVTMLRTLVIPSNELEAFLLERPAVMLRMLQAEARRLQTTSRWRQ